MFKYCILCYFHNIKSSLRCSTGKGFGRNAYYPFGLVMAGVSSKAANGLENKRKFNGGTELEKVEFSDGSGLEIYSTSYRSYDPQLGRFHQEDPLAGAFEDQSQYNYVSNNPLIFNDPSGLSEQTPGVNSQDPKDIAILEAVTVKNIPKPKLNWFGYPNSTSSQRKEWKENQHSYYTRQSTGQSTSQKGDRSSYTSSISMYKRWDKANKEFRQNSIGALLLIGSPVLITSLSGTGTGSLILNSVRPKLQTSIAGGLADFLNQKVVLKRSWGDINLATVASNTFLGGKNIIGSSLWESTGSFFQLSINKVGLNFNSAGVTDFTTGVVGNIYGNSFGRMVNKIGLQDENGKIVGRIVEFGYETAGEFSGNIISNSITPQ